ncbi:hypothetical protein Tco_0449275 [Tanacetum coccineum]
MQAARDRQKSYADLKRKPMEFQVGDKVMLKVLLVKVVRFEQTREAKPKCHADEPLVVPLDGLHLDDKLHFVEEPLEIFTWEREDQFKKKYPHLFTKTASSSSAAFTGDQPPETSSSHATTQDSRDSLEETNGNEGDQVQTPHDSPLSGGHTSDRAEGALNLQELSVLCTNLSNRVLALESIKDAQAAEISALKSRIKKLEKKCKPSISHHRAWLKSVKRLSMKKRFGKHEFVSKQGRKKSKPKSTWDDSTVFDDQDADHGMEYMETEEAVDEGRQSGETEEVKLTDDTEVVEDKSSGDKGGNAEELVSTTRPEVSTARPDIDAARQEDSVVEPRTPPTTTSIFDDEDIMMA